MARFTWPVTTTSWDAVNVLRMERREISVLKRLGIGESLP